MNTIDFIAYVSPNTQPRTINYVKRSDLDRLLHNLNSIPREYLGRSGYFSMVYFNKPVDSSDSRGGSGNLNLFLKAPELVDYWCQFPEFVNYCFDNNITWFLDQTDVGKIFVF